MIYFILIYIFSNLGAFGVVALISAQTGRETIDDYRGLYANNKGLSWVMAISLFSLAGIPPTAGFFGKFFLLLAAAGKGKLLFYRICGVEHGDIALLLSAGGQGDLYGQAREAIGKLAIPLLPAIAMGICVAGILVTGLLGWVYDYIYSLSAGF